MRRLVEDAGESLNELTARQPLGRLALLRASAASGLVLATQKLGGITGRGTSRGRGVQANPAAPSR